MKVVVIKHPTSEGKYLFEFASRYSFEKLEKGDLVLCDTKYGNEAGVCLEDSFEVDEAGLNVLVDCFNATLPLKKIVGKYKLEMIEGANND